MTAAEELGQAAQRLDELALKATPGVWKLWGMEVRADLDGTSNLDTSWPVANTSHEAGLRTFNASYIAAMYPPVAVAMAELLREQSSAAAVRDGHSPTALKIARLINGGTS